MCIELDSPGSKMVTPPMNSSDPMDGDTSRDTLRRIPGVSSPIQMGSPSSNGESSLTFIQCPPVGGCPGRRMPPWLDRWFASVSRESSLPRCELPAPCSATSRMRSHRTPAGETQAAQGRREPAVDVHRGRSTGVTADHFGHRPLSRRRTTPADRRSEIEESLRSPVELVPPVTDAREFVDRPHALGRRSSRPRWPDLRPGRARRAAPWQP